MSPDESATSRDTDLAGFLRELQGSAGSGAASTPLPEVVDDARQVLANENLVERFDKAATAVGIQVHRTNSDGWIQPVHDVLRACQAKTVLVAARPGSALPDESARQVIAAMSTDGIDVKSTLDDQTLFSVDVAITGVAAAIAETGTIVCTSGPDQARGASLIPPVHVAIVSASQILPDLCDCLAQLGGDNLQANVNLISGPSKTADIEGILVTGVHGPVEVHVVLIAP